MKASWFVWLEDESGQALSEYGLLIALIALATLAAVVALGLKLKDIFSHSAEQLPNP